MGAVQRQLRSGTKTRCGMAGVLSTYLVPAFDHYGHWVIFLVVMLESMGVPMPGETALVTAAVYAGSTQRLDIETVILAAAAGAIIGDNIGYSVGRRFGLPLLVRHGHYVHLTSKRLKLGQYLFLRYGGAIVFFGRFIAFLRTFAALLAGVNRYPWKGFLFFNAVGGIVWAVVFGVGGYYFGDAIEHFSRPVAIAAAVAAAIGFVGFWAMFRHFEDEWHTAAEKALPGPLLPNGD
jgi:membrane protein DedA with SNARE-associated domain